MSVARQQRACSELPRSQAIRDWVPRSVASQQPALLVRRFEGASVTNPNDNTTFTVYKAEICLGSRVFFVAHRYREYFSLHQELARAFPARPLPTLPPRVLFNNTSPAVVAQRRVGLRLYLTQLLQDPTLLPFTARFLGVLPDHLHDVLAKANFQDRPECNEEALLVCNFHTLHCLFAPPVANWANPPAVNNGFPAGQFRRSECVVAPRPLALFIVRSSSQSQGRARWLVPWCRGQEGAWAHHPHAPHRVRRAYSVAVLRSKPFS